MLKRLKITIMPCSVQVMLTLVCGVEYPTLAFLSRCVASTKCLIGPLCGDVMTPTPALKDASRGYSRQLHSISLTVNGSLFFCFSRCVASNVDGCKGLTVMSAAEAGAATHRKLFPHCFKYNTSTDSVRR